MRRPTIAEISDSDVCFHRQPRCAFENPFSLPARTRIVLIA
jgi:hypothetical protein